MKRLSLAPFSTMLALAVVLAWCISALALDQHLLAAQKSALLLTLGAVDGESLIRGEWWRIVISQFLHVHLLHMLFNAGCIAIVGAFIEKQHGWRKSAVVYFVGGSVGQLAGVMYYPELVGSGASQALMALCGAVIVMVASCRPKLWVIAIILIQVALDVYVAQTIKAGHSYGFLGGVLIGLAFRFFAGSLQSNEPTQPTCDVVPGSKRQR